MATPEQIAALAALDERIKQEGTEGPAYLARAQLVMDMQNPFSGLSNLEMPKGNLQTNAIKAGLSWIANWGQKNEVDTGALLGTGDAALRSIIVPRGTRIRPGSNPASPEEVRRGRSAIATQSIDGGRSYVSGRDAHFGEGGTYRDSNRTETPWAKPDPLEPLTRNISAGAVGKLRGVPLAKFEDMVKYLPPEDASAALQQWAAQNPQVTRENFKDMEKPGASTDRALQALSRGLASGVGKDWRTGLREGILSGFGEHDQLSERALTGLKDARSERKAETLQDIAFKVDRRKQENDLAAKGNDWFKDINHLRQGERGQDITLRGQDAVARSADLDRAVNAERYSIANKIALEQYKLQAKQAAAADPSLKLLLEEHAKYMNTRLQQGRENDVLSFPEWIAIQQGAKLKAIAR